MGVIRVLVERDLRDAVGLGQTEMEAIEKVYPLITAGVGSMPPILRVDVPEQNGEIDIKSAYLPGYSGIAVKVSAGFFDNPTRGLPSLGGLMILLDADTGLPQSALFDNGYLTDLRTGLAGGVAAKHLAREDAHAVGILGAGMQARIQLEALALVRPVSTAVVWARRREQAVRFAAEMSDILNFDVTVAATPEEAAGVDVLVTTTPSHEPLVTVEMLHSGLHITAVGSDAETKQEIHAEAVNKADLFVCDSVAQSSRLGELRGALAAGFDQQNAVELGAVITGERTGRTDNEQITICDLTGTGAQDTAIASLAVERCIANGAGVPIAT